MRRAQREAAALERPFWWRMSARMPWEDQRATTLGFLNSLGKMKKKKRENRIEYKLRMFAFASFIERLKFVECWCNKEHVRVEKRENKRVEGIRSTIKCLRYFGNVSRWRECLLSWSANSLLTADGEEYFPMWLREEIPRNPGSMNYYRRVKCIDEWARRLKAVQNLKSSPILAAQQQPDVEWFLHNVVLKDHSRKTMIRTERRSERWNFFPWVKLLIARARINWFWLIRRKSCEWKHVAHHFCNLG